MRIAGIELLEVRLPLRAPFSVAYGGWDAIPSLICRVTADDGQVGWGEAVPDAHVTGETEGGVLAVLAETLAPASLGADPRDWERLRAIWLRQTVHAPAAIAALDIAVADLAAKALGAPLYRLYGGRTRTELELYYVASVADPEAMAQAAHEAVTGRGFPGVKVKLGTGSPDLERARLAAVRAAVGEDVPIRVDANQGWGQPAQALAVIRALEPYRPLWVEQPVHRRDLRGLAEVRRRAGVPIMADEAVCDPADLFELIRLRAADLVNVKLMKSGGVSGAARLVRIAGAAGLGVQIGSMVESGIGSQAAAHLATALPEVGSLEASGPLLFADDGVQSAITAPRFCLSEAPGLGVAPNPSRLAQLAVRRAQVGEAPDDPLGPVSGRDG